MTSPTVPQPSPGGAESPMLTPVDHDVLADRAKVAKARRSPTIDVSPTAMEGLLSAYRALYWAVTEAAEWLDGPEAHTMRDTLAQADALVAFTPPVEADD